MKYRIKVYKPTGTEIHEFEKLNKALKFVENLILDKLHNSNVAEMEFDFIEL